MMTLYSAVIAVGNNEWHDAYVNIWDRQLSADNCRTKSGRNIDKESAGRKNGRKIVLSIVTHPVRE